MHNALRSALPTFQFMGEYSIVDQLPLPESSLTTHTYNVYINEDTVNDGKMHSQLWGGWKTKKGTLYVHGEARTHYMTVGEGYYYYQTTHKRNDCRSISDIIHSCVTEGKFDLGQ